MRRSNLRHFALVLLLSVSNAMAQITDTQSGTDFADSVAAKMPALTKPTGFGAFDTPPSTSAYSAANAKGSLGSLGSAALQRCANYVPTGDPVKDQECAGVNYMANNCLQPNATQRQVISGTANAYTGSNNCKGSYGSGAGAFDLSSQDKSMITSFGTATSGTAPQSCRTVTKISNPAVMESYSCTKNDNYVDGSCTQDLAPIVNTYNNCTVGTYNGWVGSGCVSRDCDQYTASAYCDGTNNIINVFAAGGGIENWGRNCPRDSTGRAIQLTKDGTGGGGFSISTNFHVCDNRCCGGISGYVTGLGCQGDTCTAQVDFYGVATTYVVYKKPIRHDIAISWNNNCSSFENSSGMQLGSPE